jgi:hypothetical protein
MRKKWIRDVRVRFGFHYTLATVERIWQKIDIQGQVLAMAFR